MISQKVMVLGFLFMFITLTYGLYNKTLFEDLFTVDEYEEISNKRVRREIRDISDEQWESIAAALNIMKSTPTAQGRAIYGDRYLSYDDLVCQHARTIFSTPGDLGHGGPHFTIWHRAYILSFENILIAIDPSIESLPYWDHRRDIIEQNSTYDLTNSVIFSDKYFGEYSTANDENGDYAVKTGKFAYWPINTDASDLTFECGDYYRNAFGFLRQRTNFAGTPYVIRFGGSLCGRDTAVGDLELYDECLYEITDYVEFFDCYNRPVHGYGHNGVGGTVQAYINQTNVNRCNSFGTASTTNVVPTIRKLAYSYGCYDCPEVGDCDYETDDPFECAACTIANETCMTEQNVTINFRVQYEDQQIVGDFLTATSPNDPIFIFHHANVDRYLMEWQLLNYEQSPYYNYPSSGYGTGINLDDVISPEVPFMGIFDEDVVDKDVAVTIKDVWEQTTVIDSPYTYDTILDVLEPDGDITTTNVDDIVSTVDSVDDDTLTTEEVDAGNVYVVYNVILACFVLFCFML